MNKKNKKGFTIIELIVVIAIIAILAAIVLVNVTTYINKAKDARIKSDLGSAALGAASCTAAAQGTATGCSANATTYIPGTLGSDITTQGGAYVNADNATLWCLSSKMASVATNFVCVDSSGVTTNEGTAVCNATTFKCQ